MSAYNDSSEYKAIRKLAVEIAVRWYDENQSYVGISKLYKLVTNEIIRLKAKDEKAYWHWTLGGAKKKPLWPWGIPDELTTRRRINEAQNKEFNRPNPPAHRLPRPPKVQGRRGQRISAKPPHGRPRIP